MSKNIRLGVIGLGNIGQQHIKHVVAEMGGKNAIIVDEDADLDAAVAGTLQSAFGYGGQKCSAASRVIVHASVYELFLGRLVQATDRWVGVRGARLVLLDDVQIRAVMAARWLRALGHDAAVLEAGSEAWQQLEPPRRDASTNRGLPALSAMDAEVLVAKRPQADGPLLVDCRHSDAYRAAHGEGAVWMIRPMAARALRAARWRKGQGVVLIADEETAARSLALDLSELGVADLSLLDGGLASWRAAGGPIVATPEVPGDDECIDWLRFVHDRHEGNLEAARRYLEWEIGLVGQLDADERSSFRLG